MNAPSLCYAPPRALWRAFDECDIGARNLTVDRTRASREGVLRACAQSESWGETAVSMQHRRSPTSECQSYYGQYKSL
jgi:hypothetical protein